jgi:chromosome segregation ATPase
VEEQLALKTSAMTLVEDRLLKTETEVALATTENQKLNSRVLRMQSNTTLLEAEIAEKNETLSSQEKELIVARDVSTRMTMECSHKTESLLSLQGELQSVAAERDDLKSQCLACEKKYCDLEGDVVLKNDAVSSMAAELSAAQALTSSMARDLDEMNGRIITLISEKDNLENKVLQKDEAIASMDVELTAVKESVLCLESLKSKLSELELQKGRDEEELQVARKTQLALQDEIQALIKKLADSQESNDALKLELAENITALSSLQDALSMVSGSSSDDHEEMKVMKAGIGALLRERDSLQAEVGHKSATISSLKAELVGARESAEASRDCIAALETKVVALQAETDSLDAQITELELGVISTLKVELTEAQTTLKFIDREMLEAKRVADCVSDENSALQAQVVGLEAEKGTLEVEVSCKTALVMSLEAELAAAGSSSMALTEELNSFGAQVLELQTLNVALETEVAERRTSISLRESELLSTNRITSSKVQENDEFRMQIDNWKQKCSAMEAQLDGASQEMDTMKAQITQQELQLSSLEELLAREAEALQHMVNNAVHATQECDTLRSEVEGLKDILCTKNTELKEQENALKRLEIRSSSIGNESDELRALKNERDQALVEVQTLHGELRAAQALVVSHKSSVLEARKVRCQGFNHELEENSAYIRSKNACCVRFGFACIVVFYWTFLR